MRPYTRNTANGYLKTLAERLSDRNRDIESAKELAQHLIYDVAPSLGLELRLSVGERALEAYRLQKGQDSDLRPKKSELSEGSVLPISDIRNFPSIDEEQCDMYVGSPGVYVPLGKVGVALRRHGAELSFAEVDVRPGEQSAA